MPHSIRASRIGPFQPPYPSRYDVPLKRTPTTACSSRYPTLLGLRRPPQEYGHPSTGFIYLYSAAFRIVWGLYCCPPGPGPPKFHLRVTSPSCLAPLVGRWRPSTMTLQSRLPYWTESSVGASRFPSSPGEGPPRKRIVEWDYALSYKQIYIFQTSQEKNGICLKQPCSLTIWPETCPRHRTVL